MWRSHRRHRWQASSHKIPAHPQEQVGWQAAIAGKTAPTRFRYIRKNRPAIRPPSLAGQLPQDPGTSARTGRLAGRHRWQNSSHRIPVHPQEQAGCQAAIAGRPAPTGIGGISGNRVGCQAAIPRNESAPPTHQTTRPSVSSPCALDLDPPAPSGG